LRKKNDDDRGDAGEVTIVVEIVEWFIIQKIFYEI
jgi:hypothetical protein